MPAAFFEMNLYIMVEPKFKHNRIAKHNKIYIIGTI